MLRRFVVVAFICCTAALMAAQETPKFDLFGGYSYGKLKTDSFFRHGNFNGWDSSLTYNLTPWLGLVAEASGHYGSQQAGPRVLIFTCQPGQIGCPLTAIVPPVSFDTKFHTLTVGPRFAWRTNRPVTPFAHFLVGGSYAFNRRDFGTGERHEDHASFVYKAGGGFDLRLNSLASWRTQVDWLNVSGGFRREDNFAVSTGPVFHFGKK